MKPFTDKSSASRIEKARRVLRALSNPHDYRYFFGDGYPRHAELLSDAAAALEVLEGMSQSDPAPSRRDAAEPYIRPRKKSDNETRQQCLVRRLEEYIEYAHAVRRFADVDFYEELLRHIDGQRP